MEPAVILGFADAAFNTWRRGDLVRQEQVRHELKTLDGARVGQDRRQSDRH